nr:MAG TPA: hypothetical protein [Crassvirales sp.]
MPHSTKVSYMSFYTFCFCTMCFIVCFPIVLFSRLPSSSI